MKTLLIALVLAASVTTHAKSITRAEENRAIEIFWNAPDAYDCDDHMCANYRGINFKTQICDLGPTEASDIVSSKDAAFVNSLCKKLK